VPLDLKGTRFGLELPFRIGCFRGRYSSERARLFSRIEGINFSMTTHHLVVFLNRGSRTFTVTSRMERARLLEVSAWALANGFTHRAITPRLFSKAAAEALKRRAIVNYRRRGYTYVKRPPL
jgi:hypothetical protein